MSPPRSTEEPSLMPRDLFGLEGKNALISAGTRPRLVFGILLRKRRWNPYMFPGKELRAMIFRRQQ
jgi:hypothetical protein